LSAAIDEDRRFGGLTRLYGLDGAAHIRAAHVLVIGIGGVGSWAAECLARSGVGCITLVDMDHVAESNINRQIHATDTTIGMAKIEAMRLRIASYAPNCRVLGIDDFVSPENWSEILAQASSVQPVNAVMDCCDQVQTKTALAAWAQQKSVKKNCAFITVGAAGGKRRADLLQIDDLQAVTHDPLLAQVRYRLRKQVKVAMEKIATQAGLSALNAEIMPRNASNKVKAKPFGVACVFSREAVAKPHASCGLNDNTAPGAGGQALNCAGYGSFVGVTANFGMAAAAWVLDGLASA
jgi:tRNA A37 threonylcarbamoyladenosine dehydratase